MRVRRETGHSQWPAGSWRRGCLHGAMRDEWDAGRRGQGGEGGTGSRQKGTGQRLGDRGNRARLDLSQRFSRTRAEKSEEMRKRNLNRLAGADPGGWESHAEELTHCPGCHKEPHTRGHVPGSARGADFYPILTALWGW